MPERFAAVTQLYWPVVLISSVFVLATLYHLAVPVRTRLRAKPARGPAYPADLAGRRYLLRIVLGQTVGSTSIYGPLAAPIALLIWLYVISLAVLFGAAFNAATDEVWPRLSGIHPDAPAPGTPQDSAAAGEPVVPGRDRPQPAHARATRRPARDRRHVRQVESVGRGNVELAAAARTTCRHRCPGPPPPPSCGLGSASRALDQSHPDG